VQTIADQNKYLKNKESILARNKTWKIANPERIQAADAKRRASRLQRTPAWLTEDDLWMLEQTYELAALRTKMFSLNGMWIM
jgi:hypothetical protein